MKRQIASFKSQCPSLNLARLISSQGSLVDWYAFDALTGTELWIPRGAPWDVEGKLCDDNDADYGTKPVTGDMFRIGSEVSSSP